MTLKFVPFIKNCKNSRFVFPEWQPQKTYFLSSIVIFDIELFEASFLSEIKEHFNINSRLFLSAGIENKYWHWYGLKNIKKLSCLKRRIRLLFFYLVFWTNSGNTFLSAHVQNIKTFYRNIFLSSKNTFNVI